MSNISPHVTLVRNAVIVLAICALGVRMWAQTPAESSISQNPFGRIDKALSSAADNLLTAAPRPAEVALVVSATDQSIQTRKAQTIAMRWRLGVSASQRIEQLRPLIEPILREEGVPTNLSAVVLVESGGQPAALSPKGARGIWQFMPDTARRYGLQVGFGTDERLDVQKSTRAAAHYLHDLYQRFGSWPLALAAYNAGKEAVDAASGRAHSSEFARISSWLPMETRIYVPSVLSAMGQLSTVSPRQLSVLSTAHVLYAEAALD